MSELTHEKLLDILHYDPLTGVFTWKKSASCKKMRGKNAGAETENGYIRIAIDRKIHRASRLAWFYMNKEWPENVIDHVNGIRNDNRLENLRDVTPAQNSQNRTRGHSRNTSGLPGVNYKKKDKKWVARIQINGKRFFIGSFKTKEEAGLGYLKYKTELRPFSIV